MFPFLASPLFRIGLVVAFIVGVFGTGYLLGNTVADQSARIAELERDSRDLTKERDAARAERDNANRLMKAANDIALKAAERERAAQAEFDELEKMVGEYAEALKVAPVQRSCGFTAADVERLRAIYFRAFGAQHTGTSRAPGLDGAAGEDRTSKTGR